MASLIEMELFPDATLVAKRDLANKFHLECQMTPTLYTARMVAAGLEPLPLERMERYRLYLFLSKAGTDAIHLLNCIELAEVQHSDDIDPSSLFHFADLMPSPAREVIRLAMLLRMNKALPVSTDGLPTGIAKSLLRFRELLVGGHVRSQLINVQGEEIDGHAVSQALVPTDDPEAAEFSSLVATVLERWHMGPVPALVGNR